MNRWHISYAKAGNLPSNPPICFDDWGLARDCILEWLSDLIWVHPDAANEAYESLKALPEGDQWAGSVGLVTYELYRDDCTPCPED